MADLQSLADAPGTMREYETIYILRPDTPNEKVAEINERVRGIIEKMGGKVLEVDNWGKRRLAYEVEKHLKGIYLYWQYLGTPGAVSEFERNMRMLDAVIRYMTVKVDQDVNPEARPSEVDDETYERAATTAADEEDLMMRGSGDSETASEDGEAGEASEGESAQAAGETEGEANSESAQAEDDSSDENKE
jgi:small subunit ribosomal protein S6